MKDNYTELFVSDYPNECDTLKFPNDYPTVFIQEKIKETGWTPSDECLELIDFLQRLKNKDFD